MFARLTRVAVWRPGTEDITPIWRLWICRHADTTQKKAGFASVPSALRRSCLVSDPMKDGLMPLDPLLRAALTMLTVLPLFFRTCAHPDDSRPGTTFTGITDLDAQRPEERLRSPQSTGERARI